jgi:protein CMS1
MAKRKGSENNDDRRKNKKKKKTETTGSEQLRFFVNEFQSAKDVQLSSIELESLKADSSILELSNSQNSRDTDLDVKLLGGDIKGAFGNCWRQVLCESEVVEGKIPPGSPSVLIVSTSALRSIHLLKGFRFMTKQCSAVKLFSKHIKLQEQVGLFITN